MYINFQQIRATRSAKTMHTNIFANNGKVHKFATTNRNIENIVVADMHHRIVYMYINSQQIRVCTSVKPVHKKLFANNRKLHKLAIRISKNRSFQT